MPLPRLLVLLSIAAIVGFAPAPFPRRVKKIDDREGILGFWKVTRYEMNHRSMGGNYWVKVEKDSWTFYQDQAGMNRSASYSFHIDPQAKPPSFNWGAANVKGGPAQWIGSYRLQGKRLTIIFNGANRVGGRPTDFASPTDYLMVLVFERR
jgi:uncharacterized protein (TIGR03067 family)